MRLLEAGLLGRGHASVGRVVEHAIECAGRSPWCRRCGATVEGVRPFPVVGGAEALACTRCQVEPVFDGFVRLGRYDSPLGALARRVKRQGWHAAATELGERLGIQVKACLGPSSEGWCVVSIPGSLPRRVARGIDHTHELGRAVARALGSKHVQALALDLSSRQAGLDRSARLGRVRRMRLRRGAAAQLRGRGVLLVDDVRTTGSTLREARELLIQAGCCSVVPAVLCVSDERKSIQDMSLHNQAAVGPDPASRKLVHIQNPLKEGC